MQVEATESAVNSASPDVTPPVETPAPDPQTPVEEGPDGDPPPAAAEGDNTEEKQPDTKQDEDFSRRFAALTRRERDLLARESQIKQKEQEVGSSSELRDKLKNSPLEVLEQHGWTFKDLADVVLRDGKLPPEREQQNVVQALQDEINSLKERLDGRDQQEVQSKEQKAVETFKENISAHIKDNVDKFDLINVNGDEAIEMVYDVIDAHFQNTFDQSTGQGDILDISVAAEHVERHLEEQASKLFKARKFADRLRPLDDKGEPQETPEAPPAKTPPSPTLTQRTTTSATPVSQGEYYMSDEESKRKAAEFLKERLASANG